MTHFMPFDRQKLSFPSFKISFRMHPNQSHNVDFEFDQYVNLDHSDSPTRPPVGLHLPNHSSLVYIRNTLIQNPLYYILDDANADHAGNDGNSWHLNCNTSSTRIQRQEFESPQSHDEDKHLDWHFVIESPEQKQNAFIKNMDPFMAPFEKLDAFTHVEEMDALPNVEEWNALTQAKEMDTPLPDVEELALTPDEVLDVSTPVEELLVLTTDEEMGYESDTSSESQNGNMDVETLAEEGYESDTSSEAEKEYLTMRQTRSRTQRAEKKQRVERKVSEPNAAKIKVPVVLTPRRARRLNNRISAGKSRRRKVERLDALEMRCAELEEENRMLRLQCGMLG